MNCQICGGDSRVVLIKERNVSCCDYFEGRRLFDKDSGDISLLECQDCGFGYFEDMLRWDQDQYKTEIYNDKYHLSDPPFLGERSAKLAVWLSGILPACNLLDFGGGDGKLAELLNADGFRARSYDPFFGCSELPSQKADVVTVLEVVEHVPNQHELFSSLSESCSIDGLIIMNTLLKEFRLRQDWWYASARNGHVSFHTAQSLGCLISKFNLVSISLSSELHIAAFHENNLKQALKWIPIQINNAPQFEFINGWTKMNRC